jgi:hypothetical protein
MSREAKDWARRQPLQVTEKAILMRLAEFASKGDAIAWRPTIQLADEVGCSEQTILNNLRRLTSAGLIEVAKKGGGRGNPTHYRLRLDMMAEAPPKHPKARTYTGPRAAKLDVSPEVWRQLRAVVFDRDGHRCVYCGADGVPLECDHVVPRAAGGKSLLSNLAAACKPCNSSKGARLFGAPRA